MLPGSIRIGTIAGIPVQAHLTLLILVVLGALAGWHTGELAGLAYNLALIGLLFFAVLLHELGHSLVAQRLGLSVHGILFLPFGGLSVLSTPLEQPRDELLVALAGPAVNLVLTTLLTLPVGLLFPLRTLSIFSSLVSVSTIASPTGLLIYFWLVNGSLAVCNLLPAFPLDGGRALRSGLVLLFPVTGTFPLSGTVPSRSSGHLYLRATRLVAATGQLLAMVLFVYGLLNRSPGSLSPLRPGLLLSLFAIFLFLTATHEVYQANRRLYLRTHSVAQVLRPPLAIDQTQLTVSPDDFIATIPNPTGWISRIRATAAWAVVTDGQVVGLLVRADLHAYPATSQIRVRDRMRTEFPHLSATDTLWKAQQLFLSTGLRALPVLDGYSFCGLLTLDDLLMSTPAL